MVMKKILEVKQLKVYFLLRRKIFKPAQVVHAVDGITFDVYEGETLGIVGESGCGKTSLARSLVGLTKITAGSVIFREHKHLETASDLEWRSLHREIQFIFQDPVAALNPRMTIGEIISEPLKSYFPHMDKKEITVAVLDMMQLVGISTAHINRYPSEFSGGQCQRIAIARALILKPKLIVCDESVSALDVSIKAQIINLLKDLQRQLNLTIIFISHDLGVIKHISNRVLVMYLGNIMELASRDILYSNCHHPYTKALLSAVTVANPLVERQRSPCLLKGDLPSPINPPVGCVFSSRCPLVDDNCRAARPQPLLTDDGSLVACFKA